MLGNCGALIGDGEGVFFGREGVDYAKWTMRRGGS
jgi:hypothetical protein